MKLRGFQYDVLARVEFAREELEHLLRLSAGHYDAVCRSASRVGGFLFGMRNMLGTGEKVARALHRRELDTVHKIAESEQFFPDGDVHLCFPIAEVVRALEDEKDRMEERI